MAILCAIRSPSSAASGISQTFNQSSCEIQFFGGSKMAFPAGKIGQVSRSEAIPVGAKQFLRKFDGLRGFEVSRNFQSIYSKGFCRIDENGVKLGGNGLYVDRKGSKSGNARVVYAGINSKKLSGRNLRVAVIGGGPAGGCTAETLAKGGVETFLIERKLDNAKPCGGAIPLCMVDEFKLPLDIIDRRVTKMKMISPSNVAVDVGRTLKENEYIGMVRREVLDSYLRERAASCGANVINGLFMKMELPKDSGSPYVLHYNLYDGKSSQGTQSTLEVDAVVGADGANSRVAKGMVAGEYDYAIAFQERIKIPEDKMSYYENLAEMYVGDDVSPDFYGWVFPKCDHVAVGTGTVINKPAIKEYQVATRNRAKKKIEGGKIIRVEAHPIPEHPRPRRVRDRVALVGDAAGYVTKSSGEGIYFAAKSGRMCAEAIVEGSGNGARMINEADLRKYVEKWDKAYWPTYKVLDLLQRVFYRSNAAREAFVEMCADDYVQKMTFDSYLYKTVAPGTPLRDFKLAVKTVGSLLRVNALRKEMKKLSM